MDWGAFSTIDGDAELRDTARTLGVTIGALMMRCHQLQETLHRSRPRR